MKLLLRLFRMGARLEGKLEQVVLLLKSIDQQQKLSVADDDGELLHAADVKRWLGISDTTLYRYKKKNILVPTGIDGKFYRKSDLVKVRAAGT